MDFNVAFGSDIGRKRHQNQDNGMARPELGLFIVADGMGGHRGGETASAMAVNEIFEHIKKSRKKFKMDPKEALYEAFQKANYAIYDKSAHEESLRGMGTTVTCLLFDGEKLYVGQVGDSRCYFITREGMWQLTRDHSLIEEKVRVGILTREQAAQDQMKNVITRSVGLEPKVNVDIYERPLRAGELFLTCSDGLTGLVENKDIFEMVQKHFFTGEDIKKTVDTLISRANSNGGDDNITALMVEVKDL